MTCGECRWRVKGKCALRNHRKRDRSVRSDKAACKLFNSRAEEARVELGLNQSAIAEFEGWGFKKGELDDFGPKKLRARMDAAGVPTGRFNEPGRSS